MAWAIGACAAPALSKEYILWRTISPDGRYAMAWSTRGSLEDLPSPVDDNRNLVSNEVVDVTSRRPVIKLPEGH